MFEQWWVVLSVAGPPVAGVVGACVRGWWRARVDRQRQRTVQHALAARADDGVLVREVRGDGSSLTVRITPGIPGGARR